MLSLFQEKMETGKDIDHSQLSNKLIGQWLNKGIVPSWDMFYQELPILSDASELELLREKFHHITKWTFLEEILSKEGTEFFFHSPTASQRLALSGEKFGISVPLNLEEWQLWLETVSIEFKQNWNVENPFVSFYGEFFGKSYRLSLIHASSSPIGISKLILRRHASSAHPLDSFGNIKVLEDLIDQKRNVLIAGSTGSGKTSLLSAMVNKVPAHEHLVILEDTYEILSSHSHQTRFLSGNTDKTTLKAYLSYSLRLSPDRIILGEMRSHEAIPFLLAMNTGHKGLMGTIHASSAVDALYRTSLLFSLYSGEGGLDFEKVMELVCRNLEYVVFMENKKVKEVIKVLGSDRGVPFYDFYKK